MNGLTILGLIGMGWIFVSVVLGVGVGRWIGGPR